MNAIITPAPDPEDLAESDDGTPDGAWLRSGRGIELTREPASDAARALTADVVSLILPHLQRKRTVGPKGLPRVIEEVGTILAGLLRAASKDRPVAAQRGSGRGMWHHSPMGFRAFWGKIAAMTGAGLVDSVMGNRMPSFDGFTGIPTKLWPTPALRDLAKRHGVTATASGDNWRISRAASSLRVVVPHDGLVLVRRFDSTALVEVLPPGQDEMSVNFRVEIEALNGLVANSEIRGCLSPAFRRSFRHDLRLGGRFYAVGNGNFQSMPKRERKAITIGGEPTVELDIRSSYLTIFLALAGMTELPEGDLYDIGGLPRPVVKAWFTQTFGQGRMVSHWSNKASKETRSVAPKVIRKAVLEAYPVFNTALTSILPEDLLAHLPRDRYLRAVGYYLTGREAGAISAVVGHFVKLGKVALPMHDGLIVRERDATLAVGDLKRAFEARIGITPRIT